MPNFSKAIHKLKQGDVIAYPTEAVYGLGCDPLNETATNQLLTLKKRNVVKGLILIAANWEQLKSYVTPLPDKNLLRIFATWPGPVTWVLPASSKAPAWITGSHQTIAVRVTAHPIAKALCEAFEGALVSTSANIEGKPPARTAEEVVAIFGDVYAVPGETGGLLKPTEIRDGMTGEVLRSG